MDTPIQKEIDYQKEQMKEMIDENIYGFVKGEITELQMYARQDRIMVEYRVIIERILSDNK